MNKNPKNRPIPPHTDPRVVTVVFDTEDQAKGFMAYWLDGGGEYGFNSGCEERGEPFLNCDWEDNVLWMFED